MPKTRDTTKSRGAPKVCGAPKMRKLAIEALGNFTYLLLFYAISATVALMVSDNSAVLWQAGLLAVPVIINFLLRRVCRTFWELLIAHIVLPVLMVVFMPNNPMTFVWVAAVAGLGLYSVILPYRRLPTEAISFGAVCALILVALSFWAAATERMQLVAMYPVVLVLAVAGRMLFIRMIKMDRSLEIIHQSYKQPIDRLIAFDYKLSAGIGAAFVAMAAAIYLLLIAPIVNALRRTTPTVPNIELEDNGRIPDAIIMRDASPPAFLEDMPHREPWLFWDILTPIVFAIATTLALILVVYGAYRLLMFLLGLKAHKSSLATDTLNITDEREFIRPAPRLRSLRATPAPLHPIRKLFKDTAKKHVKMGVPIKHSDTPTDMKNRIHSEDIGGLVEAYETVRYKIE